MNEKNVLETVELFSRKPRQGHVVAQWLLVWHRSWSRGFVSRFHD